MASLGEVILLSLLVLGGCAGAASTPQPTDYPLHVSGPELDIHWRLTTEAGTTRAAGLVVRRISPIREARLQLIGLDGAARIVSFSQPALVSWREVWDTEPFAVAVTPTGTEQRYEVRVLSVQHREGPRGIEGE
jgi:hypothetical protein